MVPEIVCLGEALIEMSQIPEKDPRLFYSSFGGDVSNVAVSLSKYSIIHNPVIPELPKLSDTDIAINVNLGFLINSSISNSVYLFVVKLN